MTMQELITFISNHLLPSAAAAVILLLLIVLELVKAKAKPLAISPTQTTQMMNHDNAGIIDIRSNELYRKGHIIGAQSLTPTELKATSKKLEKYKTKPLIITCVTGMESQKIAALLIKQGYNAYALSGGMRAWSAAQMPLVKE